ncbi:MAG: hypothetical protein WBV81_03555 [Ignavibacteriaceae bacterium]
MKNILLLVFFISAYLFPQQDPVETKGIYLPSIGKINVLFVFAQFPDDKLDPANPIWPKGGEPADIKKWVDEKWSRNPTPGSMTDYFNEMSFNKFRFIGKSVSVISPHSRKWYLDNKKRRGFIHQEIIKEVNKEMDFAQFDNWSLQGENKHLNKPDGIIDMIFMVWRNISNDYPADSIKIIHSLLDFNNDEGDLGGSAFTVDNGQRTVKTWWGISGNQPGGSGVTVRDYLTTNALRTCIHEFAHYLEGNNSYHSGYGFWGMLDAWGKKTQVANSFERSLLGWIDVKSISNSIAGKYKNIKLRDYVTTGDVIRITIDSLKKEYFYIENHRKLSYWENNHVFGNVEKGIYVIRQDSYYGQSLQLISASGRYYWTVNQEIENPWGAGLLPVFDAVNEDRKYGYTDMEYIPWEWKGKKMSPAPIHFTQDNKTFLPVKDVKYRGDGKDAFRMGYNKVFSPWSNPNSQDKNRDSTGIGFKLDSDNDGVYNLDIYIHTAYEAPPSKPINLEVRRSNKSVLITWSGNIEPDMKNGFYKIYRAEDKNGEPGVFQMVKKIEAFERSGDAVTKWNESVSQNKKYFYRVSAVDNSGLESVPSISDSPQ